MKKIKILCLSLALLMLMIPFASCSQNENESDTPEETHVAPKFEEIDLSKIDANYVEESSAETDYVMIKVSRFGNIIIRLFPDVAPDTVANFKKLVSEKFYDGLIFHRIIKDFMIQGGDPEGTGMGGSDETIKGEFTSNNFENNLLHKRGVVSMARGGYDNNSAASQFFIVHKTSAHLDGNYASFGYVVSGLDVVDSIASVYTDENDKPVIDVVIESIRFVSITEKPVETDPPKVAPTLEQIDFSEITDISKVTVSETATDHVMIDVKDIGKIVIRLYPDVAPETVENFKKLVSEGFYDGLTFHRVIKDFMIQTGDPLGNGYGGSGQNIKGEFEANGFENNLLHKRGVVSMARTPIGYNTASSQFFIVHADYPSLDGDYAAFGYVVYGMETVDAIANTEVDVNDKPTTAVIMTSVKFVTVS